MIAVLLALTCAVAYGLSDFVGGVASKRTSAWAVGVAGQLCGGALIVVLGLTVATGDVRTVDVGWGLLAGVGSGFGIAYLYRGLAHGRMGVVAPVSGVAAAIVPVVTGLVQGERPSVLVVGGMIAALPAIWLVASEPASRPSSDSPAGGRGADRAGIVDGLLAGLGFGLMFATVAQIPEESGVLPLAANQGGGAVTLILLAMLSRAAWVPRDRHAALGAATGMLGALAVLAFLAATHHGYLTVVAVISALYPAVTVLLAAAVLRERVHRTQGAGLVLCGLAVALVAAG